MLAEASNLGAIAAMAGDLVAEGMARLAADGIQADARVLNFAADLRYRGQAFELTIPWAMRAPGVGELARLIDDFHATHRRRFSYSNPGDAVELVTLRLAAIGPLERPPSNAAPVVADTATPRARSVWLEGGWHEIPVYRRAALETGQSITGPALIEEDYTTALIVPGWSVHADSAGHLLSIKG